MSEYITIKNQKGIYLVPLDEILYITQQRRKILVVTEKGEYSQYGKIKDFSVCLDDRFYFCLKYTILNMSKIFGISDQYFIFKNGVQFHIGRDAFNRTKVAFLEYLEKVK